MDKVYQKQLEAFGIESTRIKTGDLEKQLSEDQRAATLSSIKFLMERPDGRQWLWGMMDMCRVFTSTFVPGKPDTSDFLSGAQAVGHKILGDIMQATPEQFYVMNQEAATRRIAVEQKIAD